MTDFVFGSLSSIEKRVAFAQAWRSGIKHNTHLRPRAPQLGDTPTVTVTVGDERLIERIECVVSTPQTAVIPLTHTDTEWDLLNWRYLQTWTAQLPSFPDGTVVRYQLLAYPADGGDPIISDDGASFAYLVGNPPPPTWSQEAIIYQIFPDRFAVENGRLLNATGDLNDIYGGTLRGIIQKLDYIADLGFNCIWLNPFLPDDNTHHRYHATDYFDVNPALGTLDDIKELVEQAHHRGIRLLFDFVANHWSSQHHTFVEAQQDPHSPYMGWYNWIEWPHDYHTFFGVMDLPQVNTDHPDVRDYLIRSARFWVGEVGFDGLRLDYALGPSHAFWTEFQATLKAEFPDVWIFGEVVETPTTIHSYAGRMDGCLDFPLMQAMRDTFAYRQMSLRAFDTFLTQHERFFPANFLRPSFLDNHDMNRFLLTCQNDPRLLKLALLCQFMLAGPPIVYYGSEVGVQQKRFMHDPGGFGMAESRVPMIWDEAQQDRSLLAFYRELIAFRLAHPVLQNGRRRTVHLDEAQQTYAFVRTNGRSHVLLCLNLSHHPQTVHIQDAETGFDLEIHLDPLEGRLETAKN